jgi:serine protease
MSWEPEPEDLQPESAPEQQQQMQPSLRPAMSRPVFDRPAAPRAPVERQAPPPPPIEPPVHEPEPDHGPPQRRRFDPLLVLGLIVLLVGGGLMQLAKDVKPPSPHLRSDVEPVNGQIVVDLKDDASADQIAALSAKFGIQLLFNSPESVRHKLMVAFVDAGRRSTVLDGLRADPLVEAADINHPISMYASAPASASGFVPNDPLYAKQWHLKMIGMEQAWTVTKGKGAVVAVVDSGVGLPDPRQYRKPADFQQTDFAQGHDFVDKDDQPEDENHHGTHVAGTIAESTDNGLMGAGIAPEATVLPVRVMNRDGGGSSANITDGIQWAADHGANVINLSIGGPDEDDVIANAVKYAHDKGVFLACAAGNDDHKPVSYPGADPGCMAVSAVGPTKELAGYSNIGDQIDIAGPGGDKDRFGADGGIWQNTFERVREPNGKGHPGPEGFIALEGTSMATPHVAGVATLLVSLGKKDPEEIRSILRKSATPLGSPKEYGAGLLNAEEAVKMTGQKPVEKWVQWTALALGVLVVYILAQPGTTLSAVIAMAAGFFFPIFMEKIVGFGSIWNLLGHSVIVPVIWLLTPGMGRNALQNAAAFTFGLGLHFGVDIWTGASPFQIVPQRRIVLWFIVNLIIGAYLIVSAMFQTQPAAQAAGARRA